jgi:hypothetical protein
MMTHLEDPEIAISPEWCLDHTGSAAEPYKFNNVDPKSVFLLALLAALVALVAVLCAYLLIQYSIDAGAIPEPPALATNVL